MSTNIRFTELLDTTLNGERPFTWELWSEGFARATCLTQLGRSVVDDGVTTLADFFGDSIIQDPGHILWSPAITGYCPFNNSAHVMHRLFDLYFHVRLLNSQHNVKRIKFFRNNIARNKDATSWRHMIMQLELVGFAPMNCTEMVSRRLGSVLHQLLFRLDIVKELKLHYVG